MLWTMVVAVGLGAELWIIIGLGRGVTRRYEAEVLPAAEPGPGIKLPGTAAEPGRRQDVAPRRAA